MSRRSAAPSLPVQIRSSGLIEFSRRSFLGGNFGSSGGAWLAPQRRQSLAFLGALGHVYVNPCSPPTIVTVTPHVRYGPPECDTSEVTRS
jgi:hypothetical protein